MEEGKKGGEEEEEEEDETDTQTLGNNPGNSRRASNATIDHSTGSGDWSQTNDQVINQLSTINCNYKRKKESNS